LPFRPAPHPLSFSLSQGLALVFFNFSTLLYYNPTLSCGPKPLHVSKGGDWDPLFKPSGTSTFGFRGWASWLGLGGLGSKAVDAAGECAPQWLYFTFAAGLFCYQALDAIDGKQARRTGTSGPLGEVSVCVELEMIGNCREDES
jgi:ethanolaminephosphotransferase